MIINESSYNIIKEYERIFLILKKSAEKNLKTKLINHLINNDSHELKLTRLEASTLASICAIENSIYKRFEMRSHIFSKYVYVIIKKDDHFDKNKDKLDIALFLCFPVIIISIPIIWKILSLNNLLEFIISLGGLFK